MHRIPQCLWWKLRLPSPPWPACSAQHSFPMGSVMRERWKAFGQNIDLINSHIPPSAIYQEPIARRQVTNKSPPICFCLWASAWQCKVVHNCGPRSGTGSRLVIRNQSGGFLVSQKASWSSQPTRRQQPGPAGLLCRSRERLVSSKWHRKQGVERRSLFTARGSLI